MEGVIAMPHLGASTEESEDNCAIMAAKEVRDFIENGNIKNSVNYPARILAYVQQQDVFPYAVKVLQVLQKNLLQLLARPKTLSKTQKVTGCIFWLIRNLLLRMKLFNLLRPSKVLSRFA